MFPRIINRNHLSLQLNFPCIPLNDPIILTIYGTRPPTNVSPYVKGLNKTTHEFYTRKWFTINLKLFCRSFYSTKIFFEDLFRVCYMTGIFSKSSNTRLWFC